MKRLRKLLLLQIFLIILAILIILYYLMQADTSSGPYTKVYFTNTTIIGRFLGL